MPWERFWFPHMISTPRIFTQKLLLYEMRGRKLPSLPPAWDTAWNQFSWILEGHEGGMDARGREGEGVFPSFCSTWNCSCIVMIPAMTESQQLTVPLEQGLASSDLPRPLPLDPSPALECTLLHHHCCSSSLKVTKAYKGSVLFRHSSCAASGYASSNLVQPFTYPTNTY